MEKLIEIYLMDNISKRLKIKLLKATGKAINMDMGGNFTEEVVIELCLMINPEIEPLIAKDSHYGLYYQSYIDAASNDWV